jgi:hypothetical protein
MPDDNVQVKFGADIAELTAKMDEGNASVKNAMDQMTAALEKFSDQSQKNAKDVADANKEMEKSFKDIQEKVSGGMEKIAAGAAGLVGVLAGGKIFGDVIEATVKWDEEVGSLSHTLGISMRSASDLNAALRIVGISSGEYEAVLRTLERRLKTNEEGMNALGVATRDAQGQLLDGQTVMQNALAAMQEYKAGQDQLQFAQYVFGRGARDMTRFIELNAEAMKRGKEEAQRLGLEMGTTAYEATLKYKHELNNFHLVLDSLAQKIGRNVMPTLAEMATYLNNNLTTATDNASAHVGQLHQHFDGLSESIQKALSVWDRYIAETGRGPTNYSGTGVPMAPGGEVGWERGKGITKAFGYSGPSAAVELEKGPSISSGGGVGGGKDEVALGSGTKPFVKPDELGAGSDLMAQYTEEANRLKDSQTDLNAWSAAKDYEFWNQKLETTKQGSDAWWQIWHKMADDYRTMTAEQQAQAQQAAKQQEAISKGVAAMQKSDSETAIKIEEEKINMLFGLGQISAAQRYNMLKAEYDKEYQLELNAYYQTLETLQKRGDQTLAEQVKVWEEIEKAQNAHLQKMQKDENQYLNTEKQQWDKYATDVGNALTGMMFHHQTFLQTVQRMEEKLFSYLIDTLLKQLVNQWLLGEATKTAATTTGAAARSAAEASGTATSVIAQAAAALKSIVTSAATTFAGIFGFLSPLMGPAAAGPAAGGEAAVLAVEGMVASAAEGFDVPSTTFAVLHAREMVLPAPLAEGVRNMTAQGAGAGGMAGRGGDMHMHINATDAESFEKQLGRSNSGLNRMIKRSIRNFNLPIRR